MTATIRHLAAVAAVALATAGCSFAPIQPPALDWVDPADARIAFHDGGWESGRTRRVAYRDAWQYEEYALFQGNGARAEIVYSAVPDEVTPLALDYTLPFRTMVAGWNFNRGRQPVWGEGGSTGNALAFASYRQYRLAAADRSCFGFSAEWDHPSGDPKFRPGRVLFGYYCAAPGAALSADHIEDLIARIGIRGISERLPRSAVKPDLARPSGIVPGAARFARGDGDDTGHPDFPFAFATMFQDSDGDTRDR